MKNDEFLSLVSQISPNGQFNNSKCFSEAILTYA